MESDWNAGDYYKSGEDLADALQLAVGDVEPAATTQMFQNMDIKPELEFVAGLLDGLVWDDHLPKIQTCLSDSESVVDKAEVLVADLKADEFVKASLAAKKMVVALNVALDDCENMSDDFDAIQSWARIFASPIKLIETVSKHMYRHKFEILGDVDLIEGNWAAQKYYTSG